MAYARAVTTFLFLILALKSYAQTEMSARPMERQLDTLEEYGFRPIERISTREREAAENLIRSFAGAQSLDECNINQKVRTGRRDRSERTIAFYDQVISDMTPFILQNYSQECAANLLAHYMAEKLKHEPSVDGSPVCSVNTRESRGGMYYTKEYNYILCPRVLQERGLFLRTMDTLMNALVYPSQDLRVCMNTQIAPTNFEELSNLISEIQDSQDQIQECTETQIGETRLRKNRAFSLTRTSEKEYEVNLALDFQIANNQNSSFSAEDMRNRVKTCLASANQFFRVSNGESLNLNILSPQEAEELPESERPRAHTITYQNAAFRQNSNAYQDNVRCRTIAHELFHLLGLNDEYHEGDEGGYYYDTTNGNTLVEDTPAYDQAISNGTAQFVPVNSDCRSYPSGPNLMAQDREAFQNVASYPTTCECTGENASTCQSVLALSSPSLTRLYSSNFNFPKFRELCQFDSAEAYDFSGDRPTLFSYDLANMSEEEISNINFAERKVTDNGKLIVRVFMTPSFDNNTGAINDNLPEHFSCSCDGKDISNCEELIEKLRTEDLSQYVSQTCRENHGAKESSPQDINLTLPQTEQNSDVILRNNSFTIFSRPANPGGALLHPGHMSFIKFAGCRTRAVRFRTCQSYGYVRECPDRPAYCDEEEQWLMQEQ